MPKQDDPITEWAKRHDPKAIARVVSRLNRFANNTSDPATQNAALELLEIVNNANKGDDN